MKNSSYPTKDRLAGIYSSVGFACQKCMEVYSGYVDGDEYEPDETPEEVNGSYGGAS